MATDATVDCSVADWETVCETEWAAAVVAVDTWAVIDLTDENRFDPSVPRVAAVLDMWVWD